MQYSDMLDILQTRSENMGILAEDGMSDAIELEHYIYQALLDLTEMADLREYMARDTNITVTSAGTPDYAMPDDYGRLIRPRVMNRRGIYLYDTFRNEDLEYVEPNVFNRKTALVNARPGQFTVQGRSLWLYPTPDDNSTNNYTIRGSYIRRVARPGLDEDVLLEYPTALIDTALYRVASDRDKLTQGLVQAREEAVARLLRGSI